MAACTFFLVACGNSEKQASNSETEMNDTENVENNAGVVNKESDTKSDELSDAEFKKAVIDGWSEILPTQFMPEKEATALCNGTLLPMPAYNIAESDVLIERAYLTPTGKLVYIDDFTYERLEEGQIDF